MFTYVRDKITINDEEKGIVVSRRHTLENKTWRKLLFTIKIKLTSKHIGHTLSVIASSFESSASGGSLSKILSGKDTRLGN